MAALLGVEQDCELNPSEHSVMNFFQDIFAHPSSAEGFCFESDLPLLIDIILREVCDRELNVEVFISPDNRYRGS